MTEEDYCLWSNKFNNLLINESAAVFVQKFILLILFLSFAILFQQHKIQCRNHEMQAANKIK